LELAKCYSSDGLDDISTQSNIDMKVPAMSISPVMAKYSVSFDSQFTNTMIIEADTSTLLEIFF
jgi:hypothetical protein